MINIWSISAGDKSGETKERRGGENTLVFLKVAPFRWSFCAVSWVLDWIREVFRQGEEEKEERNYSTGNYLSLEEEDSIVIAMLNSSLGFGLFRSIS